MAHSHYIMVPISGQGIIVDPGTKGLLQVGMLPPFDYDIIFLYSHGWWTQAETAMIDYNRFLLGMAPVMITSGLSSGSSLGLGVHWPSMVSEDANTPLTVLQPFTYFNRAKMADVVGENGVYSMLRIMIEARQGANLPLPRFQLTGHSFGCKVVCAALEQLAETFPNAPFLKQLDIRVVLLEAAFDFDALEPGRSYGSVLSAFPKLRVLVTRSSEDMAVGEQYVLVQRVMNLFHGASATPGLGSAGPSPATINAAGGATNVSVGPRYLPPAPPAFPGRLVVADLSPLHKANPAGNEPFAGHHSDIYHVEIYRLISAFFFS
jgi:hypothetical protein